MLKLKLQYFGHLMWRVDSLEKTLMLGGIGGRRRRDNRGWDGWMASLTKWARVSKLRELVMDRKDWRAVIHGVTRSRTGLSDWTELNWTEWMFPCYSLHTPTLSFLPHPSESTSLFSMSVSSCLYINASSSPLPSQQIAYSLFNDQFKCLHLCEEFYKYFCFLSSLIKFFFVNKINNLVNDHMATIILGVRDA